MNVDNLWEQIIAWSNLYFAFRQAARGKRGSAPAARFEYGVADRLVALADDLQTLRYRPGDYTHFYIHEPKHRKISAAPFRDRVVHHALCNVIEPYFEVQFIAHSYANRQGKGTHRAVDQLQVWAQRYRYVLRLDVVKHFPSLDHDVLRSVLADVIHDERALWLADQIIASGAGILADEYTMVWFPGDDLFAATRPRGLPIGNLTSQFWSNCYLHRLDQFVVETLRCPAYLRYVDDFALFSDDKRQLWAWKHAIVDKLASLRLVIHPEGQVMPVTEGIPWLGGVAKAATRQGAKRCTFPTAIRAYDRPVPARRDYVRRAGCQRQRLGEPRALRRHLGSAHAHFRIAPDRAAQTVSRPKPRVALRAKNTSRPGADAPDQRARRSETQRSEGTEDRGVRRDGTPTPTETRG